MYNSSAVRTDFTQFLINTSTFHAFFLRDRFFAATASLPAEIFDLAPVVQLIATVLVPVDLYVIIFALSSIPEHCLHFYVMNFIAAMVLPVELYLVFFTAIMSHIPLCCSSRPIRLWHQPFLCHFLFLFGFCAPTTSCHHGWWVLDNGVCLSFDESVGVMFHHDHISDWVFEGLLFWPVEVLVLFPTTSTQHAAHHHCASSSTSANLLCTVLRHKNMSEDNGPSTPANNLAIVGSAPAICLHQISVACSRQGSVLIQIKVVQATFAARQ